MNLSVMWDAVPKLLAGVPVTLQLVLLALLFGFVLAAGVALMRLSGNRIASAFAAGYVFVFRGTPLLVQIFLIYYGLGQFQAVRSSIFWVFLREPYWCGILALTLNTAAYTSEMIRGGIQSVPPARSRRPAPAVIPASWCSAGSSHPSPCGRPCRPMATK